MPCRSDYMDPHPREIAYSRVCCFLDETNNGRWEPRDYEGYHPDAYNKSVSQGTLDVATRALCTELRTYSPEKIKEFTLELQMWWRDHVAGEKRRAQEDMLAAARKREDALKQLDEANAALKKLIK